MSLVELIRKGGLDKAATATIATLDKENKPNVAKVATVAVANYPQQINSYLTPSKDNGPWSAHRFRLLQEALNSIGQEFKRHFPEGALGIIRWMKLNCPNLAAKIAALDKQIDLACLSEVVSLEQYKSRLRLWAEAYLEGFRKYGKIHGPKTTEIAGVRS